MPDLAALARRSGSDPDEQVRLGALRIAVSLDPKAALARLRAAMSRGTIQEKQTAVELMNSDDYFCRRDCGRHE